MAAQIDGKGHCSYVYIGAGQTSSASANAVILYERREDCPIEGHVYCLYGDGHGESDDASDILDYVVQPAMKELQLARQPSTRPAKKRKAATTTHPSTAPTAR
ncbi:MAG: hypothetical protein JO353_03625 [Phycisphaerae bacterium]|nr:hypothetical protein [Phycisphaerae bacterium]